MEPGQILSDGSNFGKSRFTKSITIGSSSRTYCCLGPLVHDLVDGNKMSKTLPRPWSIGVTKEF